MAVSALNMTPYFAGYPFQGRSYFKLNDPKKNCWNLLSGMLKVLKHLTCKSFSLSSLNWNMYIVSGTIALLLSVGLVAEYIYFHSLLPSLFLFDDWRWFDLVYFFLKVVLGDFHYRQIRKVPWRHWWFQLISNWQLVILHRIVMPNSSFHFHTLFCWSVFHIIHLITLFRINENIFPK